MLNAKKNGVDYFKGYKSLFINHNKFINAIKGHSQSVKGYDVECLARKTFASMLVNKGIMDISEVSSILGHVGEQTLINHYLYSTKSANTRLDRLEQSLAI